MKVYIPTEVNIPVAPKSLSILVRPFLKDGDWGLFDENARKWEISFGSIEWHTSPAPGCSVLLPYTINDYFRFGHQKSLRQYDALCAEKKCKAFAMVAGDYGRAFPEFENIVYFRNGGFRTQLSPRNLGFPSILSDQLSKIYGQDSIVKRPKMDVPVVGFCGHASQNFGKRLGENAKFLLENVKRIFQGPIRRDWEILFPSAHRRAQILQQLEQYPGIKTNFVFRNKYRAGALTKIDRERTTREYYDNIIASDYVMCVRGGGNFSVRLYETLMMGRIPVFINTDCLLPFHEFIEWQKHVVWVEWDERHLIGQKIMEFHREQNEKSFMELQDSNRSLFLTRLSLNAIYQYVHAYVGKQLRS